MMGVGFVVHAPGQADRAADARYEYRVWLGPADPAVSHLQRSWPLVAAERRSDIYLLGPRPDSVLVKLRDGRRLEIKKRTRDVGTVQRWTMPVSAGFPLATGPRAALADALGLRGGLDPDTGLSPAHLLSALGADGNDVVSHTVRKSRLLFARGGCRAEVCRVAVGGQTGLTVALEATALPPIARAIDDLGLGAHPNLSYGDMLGSLAGLRRGRPRILVHVQTQERRHP